MAAGVALLSTFSAGASAQDKPGSKPAAPPGPTQQPKAQPPVQPPQPQAVMPDAEKIVLLVRTTLITLNDAIETGNFTVLRDRGAPGFREANSAARLSQAFADLTSRGVDLSVVSVITPKMTEAPTLDQEKGMLRLKGYFPGQQVQINFEILFQAVGGRWQLFGLSVQPSATLSPTTSTPSGGGKN